MFRHAYVIRRQPPRLGQRSVDLKHDLSAEAGRLLKDDRTIIQSTDGKCVACTHITERTVSLKIAHATWLRRVIYCRLFIYSTNRKYRTPGRLFSNAGSSKHIYQRPKSYLFSVLTSAFVCFYSIVDRTCNDKLPIIRFETWIKVELLNIHYCLCCEKRETHRAKTWQL